MRHTIRRIGSAAALMLAALAPGGTARASVVIVIEKILGTGVVDVDVRGSLNLTGLTFVDTSPATGFLDPARAAIIVAPPGPPSGEVDIYTGMITGPRSFGPGSRTVPLDGSGSLFGIDVAGNTIMVPQGYVSGADLSGHNTYSGTLDTLGLEPRAIFYLIGTGANTDSVLVSIGQVGTPVPEPATLAVALLALAVVSAAGALRRRRAAA